MSSVSRGCEIFKANRRKSRVSETKRDSTFSKTWSAISNRIYQMDDQIHTYIVEGISKELLADDGIRTSEQHFMKTFVVNYGAGLDARNDIWPPVLEKLKNETNSRYCVLPTDSLTSAKSMIEEIIDVFSGRKWKKTDCNILKLAQWYRDKKLTSKLAIVINDIAQISEKICEEFIHNICFFLDQIPFILIIGNTYPDTSGIIHRYLNREVLSRLNIHFISGSSPEKFLRTLMEELIFSEERIPLLLLGNIFNLIAFYFLHVDFSVDRLVQAIHLCFVNHYTSREGIKFIWNNKNERSELANSNLSDEISRLKSVVSYKKARNKNLPQSTGDENEKLDYENLRDLFYARLKKFLIATKCFYIFSHIQNDSLRGDYLTLYRKCASKNILNTKEYDTSLNVIKVLSKDQLLKRIQDAIEALNKEPVEGLNAISEQLIAFKSKVAKASLEKVIEESASPNKNSRFTEETVCSSNDVRIIEEAISPRKNTRVNSATTNKVNATPTKSPKKDVRVSSAAQYSAEKINELINSRKSPRKNPNPSFNSTPTKAKDPLSVTPIKNFRIVLTPSESNGISDIPVLRNSPRKKLIHSCELEKNGVACIKNSPKMAPGSPKEGSESKKKICTPTKLKLLNDDRVGLRSSPRKVSSPMNSVTPSRLQFLQSLKKNADSKKVTSEYEKIRGEVVSFLCRTLFKPFLAPPSDYVLSELLTYDNVAWFKQHYLGSPRHTIDYQLHNFKDNLRLNCGEEWTPDMCTMYSLHNEFEKMINLYDWLQAFVCKVSDDNYAMEDPDTVNMEMRKRFQSAAIDLLAHGYIKMPKEKLDIVTKLT